MYWRAHKTATLTSFQRTVLRPPPGPLVPPAPVVYADSRDES